LRSPSFALRLVLVLGLLQSGFQTGWTTAAASVAAFGLLGVDYPASAQASRSGGYSRPGGGSWSSGGTRRPSISGSGGYGQPSGSARQGTFGFSGGDRSMSRSYSGEALRQYQREAPPTAGDASQRERRPSASGRETAPYYSPTRRPPVQNSPQPSPGYGGQTRFGAWDMLFLLSLLNTLNSPGHAQFFRDNRDNPDYRAWRREADRMAQQDPALAGKLAELDRRLATPPAAAEDASRRAGIGGAEQSEGSGIVVLVIIIGAAAFIALWIMRRRADAKAAKPEAPGLTGSRQSRFRVGMAFPFDPSPFLLADGASKAKAPKGGGMISVEAIGLIGSGPAGLHRLYLPGRDAFLQLHLSRSGEPDECRYFNRIDEITPSSRDEWGFWIDPAQGMIGWPQFQTKDGKLYDRVWAPGTSRIEPREETETMQDVQGTRQRKLLSMLYGAHTGAQPPAPDMEYILVSAVDDVGQAWVEIHAGIDINPATLSLPSVPLSA
jgi:hypothetical protein